MRVGLGSISPSLKLQIGINGNENLIVLLSIVIGIPPACKPVVSDLWPNRHVRMRVVVHSAGERVEAAGERGEIGIASINVPRMA